MSMITKEDLAACAAALDETPPTPPPAGRWSSHPATPADGQLPPGVPASPAGTPGTPAAPEGAVAHAPACAVAHAPACETERAREVRVMLHSLRIVREEIERAVPVLAASPSRLVETELSHLLREAEELSTFLLRSQCGMALVNLGRAKPIANSQ